MEAFFLCYITSLLSFLFTIPTIHFAKKWDLVTDRATRHHPAHTHTGIVPRAGGLPIYLAFLATVLLFIPLNKIVIGILLASGLLVALGLFDDYRDTSPYLRFAANILIAALLIGFGLGIPFISNPFGAPIRLDTVRWTFDLFGTHSIIVIGNILAVLWLVWTTNMVNWSKGVDGQLPGFVAITAIFLGLVSQRFTAHDVNAQTVMLLSFTVAGAYIGFLPHNFYPQKIMPGYGGGGLAGFLLGALAILSFGKIGTAILILAVPTLDAVYSIIRRIRRGQSPFRADWGHFHHQLLAAGWGRRRIAVFYWSVSAVLGVASLFLEGIEKVIAFVMTGLILIAFMIIIQNLHKRDVHEVLH